MGYTLVALEDKILQLHPEIAQMDIAGNVLGDPEQSAEIVRLKKGKTELSMHLEKEDAGDCMKGVKCLNLAVQVAQVLEEFKEAERGPLCALAALGSPKGESEILLADQPDDPAG